MHHHQNMRATISSKLLNKHSPSNPRPRPSPGPVVLHAAAAALWTPTVHAPAAPGWQHCWWQGPASQRPGAAGAAAQHSSMLLHTTVDTNSLIYRIRGSRAVAGHSSRLLDTILIYQIGRQVLTLHRSCQGPGLNIRACALVCTPSIRPLICLPVLQAESLLPLLLC
jgi:hypothetical protein